MSPKRMSPPRLKLVDGNLELLTAALAGGGALEALLGVSVADDWAGFPEALPILRESYAKTPEGHEWGSLFFVEPHAGVLVGFGGFKGPPSSDAVVEIGYAIAPAFQGQGLATDAVAQMVRRAFEDASVRAVDAHTLGHANPSTRVLEKSGFQKIGEANDPDAGLVWHWRRERQAPAPYFQPRVMRHLTQEGSVEYAIHDVYFTSDGSIEGYTLHARSPRKATVGDLKRWVDDAFAQGAPVVCGDLGYTHLPEHFAHWLEHIDEPPIDYCDDDGVRHSP